jgi:Xaa-Pro aminopeptidase
MSTRIVILTSPLPNATLNNCTHFWTEPGYYADGRFGIRIESSVIVREAQTPNNFGDKGYLEFENVTMVRSFYRFASLAE